MPNNYKIKTITSTVILDMTAPKDEVLPGIKRQHSQSLFYNRPLRKLLSW